MTDTPLPANDNLDGLAQLFAEIEGDLETDQLAEADCNQPGGVGDGYSYRSAPSGRSA